MSTESGRLRTENARAKAHTYWASMTPAERSRARKASYRRRFENQVDPQRKLPAADRAVLVESAIKAYTAKMRAAKEARRG